MNDDSRFRISQSDAVGRMWVRRLFTDWWVVVIASLMAACAALAFSWTQPVVFESSVTLYVTSGTDGENPNAAYQSSLASQQRVESYAHLVRTESFAARTLALSGLSDVTPKDVSGLLSSDARLDTVLLSISAQGPNPNQAAHLANSAARAMLEYVKDLETPASGGPALAKLTIVSPATPESVPVSPRTKRNVAYGVAVGAVIGLLLILLLVRFDTRVRSSDDLRELSDSPTLGAIPSDPTLGNVSSLDFGRGFSPAAEAYRHLRTNISFVRVDDPVGCLVVASASPGEGKTTTSMNLAAAFSESGLKVLIIDADLRRPRLHECFGVSREIGLTSILRDDIPLADGIQGTGIPGLDIIASGPTAPNPAELLGSNRAEVVFSEAKRAYDMVIVDVPPILPVADGLIVSRYAGGVLVVVRTGFSSIHDLSKAVDILDTGNVDIFGFVLNDVASDSGSYRYDYVSIDSRDNA
ncbi:polysaccharide biosynthesis tyrosine autokinase [Gordonia sp. YY1]|uniref:polysaccharide biosynthesis tyrosine autokinase n=1 Tax=Gordonia sp. YY1 TaxID=396712 RepID=UPI0013319BE9|nr:polysaccharide biosynthesis tyrosine autokinase [Gordonia sp. YY1]KAF0970020.1 hypothetical protein BPODLACK_01711 [Gordonia sp. YY1]